MSMQSYWKQPKIHGTNHEPTGNGPNFLCLHMISKDAVSMCVPGSDGNHVSESPREVPLTSLASQLQEMDNSILDTPSLTLWSKGKERTTINLYCPRDKTDRADMETALFSQAGW